MIIELLFNKTNILALLCSVFCLFVTLIALSFYKLYKIQNTFKRYNIPGPEPSVFKGGNFYEIIKADTTYDILVEWTKKYGKYYGFSAGRTLNFVTTDLEFLRKVFFENNHIFTERQDNLIQLEPMFSGILFAPHHRWKPMRKVLTPAFNFYGSKDPNSTAAVKRTIDQFISYLDGKLEPKLDENNKKVLVATNVDIHDVMKAMSLSLVSEVALNLKECPVGPRNKHVIKLDRLVTKFESGLIVIAAMFPMMLGLIDFLANKFEYKAILDDIYVDAEVEVEQGLAYLEGRLDSEKLRAIYKDGRPDAILHRMIILHHEKQMTRNELMGNVSTILIAGFDTTSTTLTYCYWYLGKFPEIQERVREDVKKFSVESPYLEQFINETMRLSPAVLNFTKRQSNREVTIDGWTLPIRTNVTYNSLCVFMDPDIWPEPEKFDPDRFRADIKHHPCAFAPFGLGERRCLGYKLAIAEMKHALTFLLFKYRVKLLSPEKLVIVRSGNVLSKPKEKVYLEFELLDDATIQ